MVGYGSNDSANGISKFSHPRFSAIETLNEVVKVWKKKDPYENEEKQKEEALIITSKTTFSNSIMLDMRFGKEVVQ